MVRVGGVVASYGAHSIVLLVPGSGQNLQISVAILLGRLYWEYGVGELRCCDADILEGY